MRAAILLLVLAGCAGQRWALLYPPERAEPGAPKGVRLLPKAPLDEWSTQATFTSADACRHRLDTDARAAVDRARATAGDVEAKYDLPLRRAVSARCVQTRP